MPGPAVLNTFTCAAEFNPSGGHRSAARSQTLSTCGESRNGGISCGVSNRSRIVPAPDLLLRVGHNEITDLREDLQNFFRRAGGGIAGAAFGSGGKISALRSSVPGIA